MSNYQQWQLEKYGNVIKEGNNIELENGLQAAENFTTWIENEVQHIINELN